MFMKLLTGLVVLAALVWMLMPRRRRRIVREPAPPPPPRVPRADDLVKCARCGVWLPAGESCDCNVRV